jgi:hypothetical protein
MPLMRLGPLGGSWFLTLRCNCFCSHREVDTFIEKLESTIAFLAGIEDGAIGTDDDFVPFI